MSNVKIGGMAVQLDKEMERGIAKIIMLSIIKRNKTYPYAILKIMKSVRLMHGHKVFEGFTKSDVYNLLTSLEKDGFIKSKATLKGNRVQKMYTITPKGEKIVKNKDKIFTGMINSLKRMIKEEFYG